MLWTMGPRKHFGQASMPIEKITSECKAFASLYICQLLAALLKLLDVEVSCPAQTINHAAVTMTTITNRLTRSAHCSMESCTLSSAMEIALQVQLRGENEFTALSSLRTSDGQAIIIIFHELLGEIVRPGSKISIDYGRIVLQVTGVVQGTGGQKQKRPSIPGSPSHQSMYLNSGSSSIKARVIVADTLLKSGQVRAFEGTAQIACPTQTCSSHEDFAAMPLGH